MDNHQTPSFFASHHVASPRHLFFFFWKLYWKSCLNMLLRTTCRPSAVVSQAIGGLWLDSQWCQQEISLEMAEARMAQHPQPMLGWRNPQGCYRTWALFTIHTEKREAMGPCHSSLYSAEATKCLVAHQNVQADVAPVWVTSHWRWYPLHKATPAGMPPPLTQANTLH